MRLLSTYTNRHVMSRASTYSVLALGVALLPSAASAVGLLDILVLASRFLNGVIGLFITLAIVIFFWGLIKYLVEVGEQKSEGLKIMFYGVIAIFVMVSLWGIIRVLQQTFGVQNNQAIPLQGLIVQP